MVLTCSNFKPIRILHVSDVHVFHSKNDTVKVLDKLRKQVLRSDLDMIFFGGDFFDTLGSLAEEPLWPVFSFAAELLRHCQKHDIILRILKGTPSHDWDQNRIFSTMARVTNTENIVRVVNDIKLEWIEKFDLQVLYIPDEASPTTAITFNTVMHEMARLDIDQVDICLMHGTFDYQLPLAPENQHNSEAFNKIVKYFTSVGHIHQNSRKGNIIAQGSFDRICHGDEGAKGLHITTLLNRDGKWSTEFIENTEALIFKTIDLSGIDVARALHKCNNLLSGIPDGSYIRYLAESTSVVYQSLSVLQSTFPQYHWTKKPSDIATRKNSVMEFTSTFTSVQLTRENLGQLLRERVLAKHALVFSEATISRIIDKHL